MADSHVEDYLAFLNKSVSPYHAIADVASRLEADGFEHLQESSTWTLAANKKYYTTRDGASLFAFKTGADTSSLGQFVITGTHCESPVFKIKSTKHAMTKEGLRMVAVEPYGGGLWQTWVDRDLSVSGRLMVSVDGHIQSVLVDAAAPLFRFPSIAIHLAEKRDDPLKFDLAKDFIALFGDADEDEEEEENGAKKSDKKKKKPTWDTELLRILLDSAGLTTVAPDAVLDFDLDLHDITPAGLIGRNKEFIAAQRQDDLFGTYHCMVAFQEATVQPNSIHGFAVFNHEEIGSRSNTGANSLFTDHMVRRIAAGLLGKAFTEDALHAAIHRSVILSCDMAHSIHPTMADRHDKSVEVRLNKGIVLKISPRQAYASSGSSSALVRMIAKKADTPLQIVSNKNTVRGGGTIGSMISALTGIMTADVGAALLGMHSIRELCGVKDVKYCIDFTREFYNNAELRMDLQ